MHPRFQIEAIREEAGGEVSASEIRRAMKLIERSTPAGIVMSTIATRAFEAAVIEAAEGRSSEEEKAWLTLAAAGSRRTRLVLSWYATKLVDPDMLVQLVARTRKPYVARRVCERIADAAGDDEAWGAWLLLSWLYPSRIRAMVKAHPQLSGKYQAAKAALQQQRSRRRAANDGAPSQGRINPVIAEKFQALGLA